MDAPATSEIFLFEGFRLDRRGGGLFRKDDGGADAPVAIGSRALEILGVLIARAGEVVSKDEIIASVWPGTIVEDSNLTVQISALRRVLDQGRTQGSCIQTVPGRGYRFVVAVANRADEARSARSAVDGDGDDGENGARPTVTSFPIDAGERWPVSRHILGAASSTRRLAAILAADVAGYSRLMGTDEEGTHERLRVHLRQLIGPKINEHRGRIVKNTGDGLLAEFASVVDAVRCATEMQRGMIDREPGVPDERRIKFRIGINLGDVIAEGGDIFGDGVNVAARLEALAEPGGICVSGVVRDQIHDKLPFLFEDLGEQNVKNIARPVRVCALRPEAIADLAASSMPIVVPHRRRLAGIPISAVAGAALVLAVGAWWLWPAMKLSRTPEVIAATSISQPLVAPRLSIVVLPFADLSVARDQQYFADGITDDLTTDLSRIAHMFVISRNTAFTYRTKQVDTKRIGRELDVRYVLEGSIRRSGEEVRVNVQLIDAETDAHLWAERFDSNLGDLFGVQNEITGRIANALGVELVAREAVRPTDHPDALDYIFRGRAASLKPPTPDSYAEAIGLFERALSLDPQSAEAQSRLAIELATRVLNGMSTSRAADIARAETLAGQALAASPRSLLAHYAKAQVLRAQRRCDQAIPEYETVISSNRNAAAVLVAIAQCKLFTGAIDEVIPLVEQAMRLSPRDPHIFWWYFEGGRVFLLQSHTDEAILWLEKARSSDPAHPWTRILLASAYGLKGETDRAAAELAEARRLDSENLFSSIARLKALPGAWREVPKIRALYEATYFAGLRKAGMPEQ